MHQHVVGYSLIDISQNSALQLQNYNSLLQTIALRGNPLNVRVSMAGNQPLTDYDFGENYGGNHNIWVMSFVVEQPDVFANKFSKYSNLLIKASLDMYSTPKYKAKQVNSKTKREVVVDNKSRQKIK